MEHTDIFARYFNAIYFFIVGFTVAEKTGGDKRIACRWTHRFHFCKSSQMAIEVEDFWIEKEAFEPKVIDNIDIRVIGSGRADSIALFESILCGVRQWRGGDRGAW